MKSINKTNQEFLLHCRYEKRLNEKTLKAYSTDLRQFTSFVTTNSNFKTINEIDKNILIEYHRDLHQTYKVKSIKRKVACVKALFNYYEFENDEFVNPFRKIRFKLKEPFRVPVVLNFGEVKEIFNRLYNLKENAASQESYLFKGLVRDVAFLELLFATGLRVSEITNLKAENINLVEGVLKVNGKGGKDRVIQVCNESVRKTLEEYVSYFQNQIDTTGYFFINRLGKRLSEQSARGIVRRHAQTLGLSKTITPHTYRHTFATLLLEEGVDIKYIQRLLGHSSILTTQIYTHVTSVKQREILTTKHPRNRMIMSPQLS